MAIEREADVEAGRGVTAAHLRDGARRETDVARIFALGRIDEKEVLADLAARAFDARQQLFLGRARIGRAFKRQYLAGTQIGQQRIGRVGNEAQIGLAMAAERRRDTDDQRVAIAGACEIGRRLETRRMCLRSEEHTSELQSLMRISYAVFS